MKIEPTKIPGVFVIEADPRKDERGMFARTFDAEEFAAAGLDPVIAQCSTSRSTVAATLRGMHFQSAPYGEAKLIRCTRGRIFDVAVDVRPDSPTYGSWAAWDLEASDLRSIYLPEGVAHGFLTLTAHAEVYYQMSAPYRSDCAVGFRWDDPLVRIAWPMDPAVVSDRDERLPPFGSIVFASDAS